MKAFYDEKPSPFEAIGNGSYFYRYDIEEVVNEEDENTQWACQEVVIWGNLDRSRVVKAVIEDRWSISKENKILNDYIGATNEFFAEKENAELIATYEAFLVERKELKDKVNNDWEEYRNE